MATLITDKSAISLSIRLLRTTSTVDTALREGHGMEEVGAKNGRLFVQQTPPTPPGWMKFINDFAAEPIDRMENKSTSAVLFLEVPEPLPSTAKRTMALSFGGGFHALDPDAFERNFGLRVALNAIPRANLRNLDVATLDATTFQKRTQASRNADLGGFGVDIQRDLLRLAGGMPMNTDFARSLAGKDALTLHTKTSAADVIEKCKTALRLYGEKTYQTDYAWIDYVTPVLETDRIATLDELAFAELESWVAGNPSDLHLALPDIISPEADAEIGYYGVGLTSGSKSAYPEVAIEDYVAELKAGRMSDISGMSELKGSHQVCVVKDGRRDKDHRRKLYDCFVLELVDSGKTYVLFGGEWYQVDPKFHAEVERDFRALLSSTPFIASTQDKTEQALIATLETRPDLVKVDQIKASPAGAAGANFEPCDFLSRSRQLIHLKDGHSSAPISHLWNQGVVSGEAFIRDATFRKKFRDGVIKRQKAAGKTGFELLLPDGRSKPVPSAYTIVFGIMRTPYKKSGKLDLPFFSKVSLRSVAQRLQTMSYPVEVHLIEKLP